MKLGWQFTRFGLVGVLNTAIQYAVFAILFRLAGLPMLLSSALGYLAGLLNSYYVNRKWTFAMREGGNRVEFARFLVVNLLAMGMNLLALKVLVARFGMLPEAAQILAIGASLVVNFAGNRWWTFRTAEAAPEPDTNGADGE